MAGRVGGAWRLAAPDRTGGRVDIAGSAPTSQSSDGTGVRGDVAAAAEHYRRAARLTTSQPEQRYLNRRLRQPTGTG